MAVNAVGIVAEYNPFHLGHAYHIRRTKEQLGQDRPVVCVMSGNWVQRGECALIDKWTRATLALEGGADLVLELPLGWAISSAEGFARGAVALLQATGVVDTLSFGSESGALEELGRLAAAMEGEDYRTALGLELDKGKSFARARQEAAQACLGEAAERLSGPNDSLGVEYLRAAGESLKAVAVLRKGAAHDSGAPGEGFASASAIRALARRGQWGELEDRLPTGAGERLRGAGIAEMKYAERAFLARLRQMAPADFAALPDSGRAEGLPERLAGAAKKAGSLEEFYALAKTRRYAHARIRRLALWAFLGLTADDRPLEGPAYLRVLGMSEQGKVLLREMKERATLPVLTKPAHIGQLGPAAQRIFDAECRGSDLFGLCFQTVRPCGMEYTTGPVLVPQSGTL